ncbi:MAG: prepilin-type N-terminal cleavage/methylation domain-containing protein [Planctomycetes bacterium]|nr:prepilin-type N-terminal cleavage/methylation domain-containing protein [Planctomycetota bacterium]MBT4028132.1 prepilin-type N-terminal cleavage/methylation domain-containing protein [Planctomycetota bacterium]MBT4560743.1 prepilin-type N-terminal cleavage/methylation domain-containing protein [Planctomycetota bacterium]MBT5100444.1 prepilin-type N-terminal cleavage/methylation domain-containing protein [Planctomycetota bacterium]MBT5121092.1 prepilin-type N-terminal cleavage/methylation do
MPTSLSKTQRGFTLVELMLVLLVIGVMMGLGMYGIDRMDPGSRGLQSSLIAFVESSRDRARATGRPVSITVQPPTETDPARLVRRIWRRRLEATFEDAAAVRENILLADPATAGGSGRCGAGLDARQGGGATLEGRGGVLRPRYGLSLTFDVLPELGTAGSLLEWPGLLSMRVRQDGSLHVDLHAGDGDQFVLHRVQSAPSALEPNRWHHIRLDAENARITLWLNGKLVLSGDSGRLLAEPESAPFLGDPTGRFQGRFDEFSAWVVMQEAGPELRDDLLVVWEGPLDSQGNPQTLLSFDRDGLLDRVAHPAEVELHIVAMGDEVGSLVVGRFTEEVAL